MTKDAAGCISGVDEQGRARNVLGMFRGQYVEFVNLSDAPHDMIFSGANTDNLPAQYPGATMARKQMMYVDDKAEMIECSFHGKQLGTGYKVKEVDQGGGDWDKKEGHRPDGSTPKTNTEGPSRINFTGLADVGREVMSRGRPEDVKNLLASRPELMEDLKGVRPLLADEIAKNGLGAEGNALASAGVTGAEGLTGGGAGADGNFSGVGIPGADKSAGAANGVSADGKGSNGALADAAGMNFNKSGAGGALGALSDLSKLTPAQREAALRRSKAKGESEEDSESDPFGASKSGKGSLAAKLKGMKGGLRDQPLIAGNSGVLGGPMLSSSIKRGIASLENQFSDVTAMTGVKSQLVRRWPWILLGLILVAFALRRTKSRQGNTGRA